MREFAKYQGLGNDYLVIGPHEPFEMSPACVARICDRHFGVGSDGLLIGPLPSASSDFRLRIINPDGSEAEKSGNGLRIFARYLYDLGQVALDQRFTIETLGGEVTAQVLESGAQVRVGMGQAQFLKPAEQTVAGGQLTEALELPDGGQVDVVAVSVGNPHCVVLASDVTEQAARSLGPHIERHVRFPNRTNVQLLEVLDRHNIRIEIWERGAGYTLASGSSASASAAVAHAIGKCDSPIRVHMPGGELKINVSDDFDLVMQGPVCRVAQGEWDAALLEGL